MEIVKLVQSVIGKEKALLHAPWLVGNENHYAKKVIDSGHLSAGSWVDRLQEEFCYLIGCKYAIAVVNATCGLHAIVNVLPKKEVYRVPSLTFVATANAISYANHNIRFVEHYGYSDVIVDVLGHPHFQVGAFIRDCAQALGSKRYGRYVGSQGTGVFSFNQNKIITAGGGGMIVTDDAEVAEKIRHLVTTAKIAHPYKTAHDSLGFNYRMSDVTAAILCAQLENLPTIIASKRALAGQYRKVFSGTKYKFWEEPEGAESNFWLNAVVLDNASELYPSIEALHKVGILAKPLYEPIHRLPFYSHCEKDDLSKTEDMVTRTILLPSSPHLGNKYV